MAQEIRTRVAAAEEHARLDAEQVRYSKFTVASAHSSLHTNLTPCIWNDQEESADLARSLTPRSVTGAPLILLVGAASNITFQAVRVTPNLR